MKRSQNILQKLDGEGLSFSKSDKKLAEYVATCPQDVIHLSIVELAKRVKVSEPTVNRFSRKLGCTGFPDFKMQLAQEISSSGRLYVENVDASDDTTLVMQKIMNAIQTSVSSIVENTNPGDIDTAADMLSSCKSISLFGLGASGPVALDAQHKFLRFGLPVVAHTDFINQRMICAMLSPADVVIIISYTGRTKALVECARLANAKGVPVIGLTRKGSPLGKYCDVVLNAVTQEDTDLFTPMTSRIVHLALIDLLATVVALRMGKTIEENIRSIKSNIADTRVDEVY
jgi:RpiR family transcriptional regulator, carbohydrate utilization regulator